MSKITEDYSIDNIEARNHKKGRRRTPGGYTDQRIKRNIKKGNDKGRPKRMEAMNAFNAKYAADIAESERLVKEQFDFSMLEKENNELYTKNGDEKHRGCRLNPLERSERILSYLNFMKDGCSFLECNKRFKEKYNATDKQLSIWSNEARKMLEKYTVKDIDEVRNQQVLRLEGLLEKVIARNDFKTANSIIDTINKIYGLYAQKVDVAVAPVIKFSFGGMDNTPDTSLPNAITIEPVDADPEMKEIRDDIEAYQL